MPEERIDVLWHRLKTWPQYFQAIVDGKKTFEIRKNDRDFQTGDFMILEEYNPENGFYTSRSFPVKITYMLYGPQFGVEAGYCVMGITPYQKSLVVA